MAHHGGQTSLPRAHRPRAPIMSVPAPLTAPLAPLRSTQQQQQHSNSHHLQQATSSATTSSIIASSSAPAVSLVTPRPDAERKHNEYVETPFRVHVPSPPPPPRVVRPTRLPLPPPSQPAPAAVTKQPQPACTFSKEPQVPIICDTRQSIICEECGRCSCQSCKQPRPLPECWTSTYRCSADTVIDYASCLCCVKGLFYHCSESDGGDTCVDQPCNCGPDRRTARWGCMAALSCVLPCLLLYWPLQCGKRVVEACYARHSRIGCRCRPKTISSATAQLNTPEKRLLDGTPDF